MGWVKGTVIAAGVLAATAALGAQRERVIVTPQIEIFQGERAQLGLSLRDLDEASAREHKLASPEGALVERVEPESAAGKAGVKAGDVITSFDGERVRSVRQLQRLVADTPPDRPVKIGVMRDGRKTEVTATLATARGSAPLPGWDGVWPDDLQRDFESLRDLPRAFRYEWRDQAPGDRVPRREPRTPWTPMPPNGLLEPLPGLPRFPFNGWTSGAGRLGVVVQELTPQLADYFGSKEGVLVASVTEGSPAAHAGIKAGDVITTANGKAVSDVEALLGIVRAQPDGEEMAIGLVRNQKPLTVKVKLVTATRARPI